jgi:lipopolysaccharide export system protein LptA
VRWQRWARVVVAAIGLGCAAAIYLLSRDAPAVPKLAEIPAVDAKVIVQSGPGLTDRFRSGNEWMQLSFESTATYDDGRTRFNKVHVVLPGDKGFETWADVVEEKGKAVQPDNPSQIDLMGHVRVVTPDGMEVLTDRASYDDIAKIVNVPGPLSFSKGRMSGEGEGATYDRGADVLSLLDRAHVVVAPDETGTGAADATSKSLTFPRTQHYMRLAQAARIVRDGDTLSGDTATLFLNDDETRLRRIELRKGAKVVPSAAGGPNRPPDMRADDIDLAFHDDGRTMSHATLVGRTVLAQLLMAGDASAGRRVINGARIDLDVAKDGKTLTRLDAGDRVVVQLQPPAGGLARTIHASTLVAQGNEKEGLKVARFDGKDVEFKEDRAAVAGKAAEGRTITSRTLVLTLNGQLDAITEAEFRQVVELKDANGSTASADWAHYTEETGQFDLRPAEQAPRKRPHAENDRLTVDADAVRLYTNSDRMDANGAVLTTSKATPAGGRGATTSTLFDEHQPIHGSGATLAYNGSHATYTGAANRLAVVYQGDKRVSGDEVVLDTGTNDLTATGHVVTQLPVESAPAPGAPAGAAGNPQVVKAASLVYQDAQRTAVFTGAPATLTNPDGTTVDAKTIDVLFAVEGKSVERLVADGDVNARLTGGRRAVGQHLEYTAAGERYVLEGGPGGAARAMLPQTSGGCTLYEGKRLTFARGDGSADGFTVSDNTWPCNKPIPIK